MGKQGVGLEKNGGEVMSWTDGFKKGPKVAGILKCTIGMGVPGCSTHTLPEALREPLDSGKVRP